MKLSVDTDRCAPFTRTEGIDPIGSAGHYHSFVLVEVELPWPREITEATSLDGVSEVVSGAEARDGRLTRVLGLVPRGDRGADQRRVIHYHRPVQGPVVAYEGRELVVDAGDEVATIEAMLAAPDDDRFTPVAGRDALICTHGSRDVCCGGDGSRLHLAVADRIPGVRVWRCSHTGGHRYAPTTITFPSGRFWAFLDEERFEAVVRRRGDVADLRGHDRGSSGFATPFAQAAERELFARVGWSILDGSTWVHTEELGDDAGTVVVAHRGPDGRETRLRVASRLARRYPAMVCGEGADPSGKTFDEYEVLAVDELS